MCVNMHDAAWSAHCGGAWCWDEQHTVECVMSANAAARVGVSTSYSPYFDAARAREEATELRGTASRL